MVSNENKEKKKRNEQNRTRNQSLNFHVSPAERKLIERRIELSGLDKASFFIESCLYQKILVKGNIKSFDKIKKRLDELEGSFPLRLFLLRWMMWIWKRYA